MKRVIRPSEYRVRLRRVESSLNQLSMFFGSDDSTTLDAFFPTYIGRCEAEREKPSSVKAKQDIFEKYLSPCLGDVALTAIGEKEITKLKNTLKKLSSKSVNNVLTVLRSCLKAAKALGHIGEVPDIAQVKAFAPLVRAYTFDEFEEVIRIAGGGSVEVLAITLLAGHAGMRRGEIRALQWQDVDFGTGKITIQRNLWQKKVGTPKSGRMRTVPISQRLREALEALPRNGVWVLSTEEGEPLSNSTLTRWFVSFAKKLPFAAKGCLHVLRHTFCSHLAMMGAPSLTIKELAGHSRLDMTQRYMHLEENQKTLAIALLDGVLGNGKKTSKAGDSFRSQLTATMGTGLEPVPPPSWMLWALMTLKRLVKEKRGSSAKHRRIKK